MRSDSNLHGSRYFFAPSEKNIPAEIVLVGRNTPSKSYNISINSKKHPNSLQLFQFEYVTEGKGFIELDNSVTEVSEGDFFLIGKNVPRRLYSDEKMPWGKMHASAKGPLIEAMVKSFGFNATLTVVKTDVKSHFEAIINKAESEENQTTELSDFIVCELLKVLQKAYNQQFPTNEYNSYKVAYDIADYLTTNLHRKVTLDELSENFFMGKTHLIALFKMRYHTTPMDYLQRVRMSRALYFLLNTDMEISKIAELSGFVDHGYFAKVFKKFYGSSPLAYKMKELKKLLKEQSDSARAPAVRR